MLAPTYLQALKALKKNQNPTQAKNLSWFFKTGPGEYGEGDVFWGIKVPIIRQVSRQFYNLPLLEAVKLLKNKVHEVRLLALLILVQQFKISSRKAQEKIFKVYLANTKYINNWDLVDLSAPKIVGGYLFQKGDWSILIKLSRSKLLWNRRVAMLATFYFIRENNFVPALTIAKMLLGDKHDLMHKAVGWGLREVGKRQVGVLKKFLNTNIRQLPRTTLRYAIERLSEKERLAYLNK